MERKLGKNEHMEFRLPVGRGHQRRLVAEGRFEIVRDLDVGRDRVDKTEITWSSQ